jgi:ABC-type lipoprotein export system ATPase subunit
VEDGGWDWNSNSNNSGSDGGGGAAAAALRKGGIVTPGFSSEDFHAAKGATAIGSDANSSNSYLASLSLGSSLGQKEATYKPLSNDDRDGDADREANSGATAKAVNTNRHVRSGGRSSSLISMVALSHEDSAGFLTRFARAPTTRPTSSSAAVKMLNEAYGISGEGQVSVATGSNQAAAVVAVAVASSALSASLTAADAVTAVAFDRPILHCIDLTVFTPDGSRTLIGDIAGDAPRTPAGTVVSRDKDSKGKSSSSSLKHKKRKSGSGSRVSAIADAVLSVSDDSDSDSDRGREGDSKQGKENQPSSPTSLPSRLRGVNIVIHQGERILVSGPSGAGKSSLLRVISGLWEVGSGLVLWSGSSLQQQKIGSLSNRESNLVTITKTTRSSDGDSGLYANMDHDEERYSRAPDGVFFLPQKPYNLLGTLRQQIAYPSRCPGEYGFDVDGDDDEDEGFRDDIAVGEAAPVGRNNKSKSKSEEKKNETKKKAKKARADSAPSLIDKNARRALIARDHRRAAQFMSQAESDNEMLDILRRVRLGSLAARMGGGDERRGLSAHRDWSKVLSLGEQQRLAFARVLYNRHSTSVVVLDEATSALDAEAERAMYAQLAEMRVTYISVGHNSSLLKYHNKKLLVHGPGYDVECVDILPQDIEGQASTGSQPA